MRLIHQIIKKRWMKIPWKRGNLEEWNTSGYVQNFGMCIILDISGYISGIADVNTKYASNIATLMILTRISVPLNTYSRYLGL